MTGQTKKNILIAEDSKTQLLYLQNLLEGENYIVKTASNGAIALELAKHERFDLIISDVMMPELTGFQLTSKIKREDELDYKPTIILLTTLNEIDDIATALEASADYYITKPYNPKFLLNTIEQILTKKNNFIEVNGSVEFQTAKKNYNIASTKSDLLKLLVSSWQHIIEQNRDLLKMRQELKSLNQNLEKKVEERTKELLKEIEFRKKTEEQIRLFHMAVEQSPSSVLMTDIDGNIEYVNKKFSDITGFSQNEVIGQNPRIFNSGKNEPEIYKSMWDSISNGKSWEGELINKKKSGEFYIEELRITPIKDVKGNITKYLAIKSDISERKAMIEELIQAKQDAEKSDQMKSNFVAQMSHEIRTPLNAIVNAIDLVETAVSPLEMMVDLDLKDAFNSVSRSTERLIRTIDLILNYSEVINDDYSSSFSEVDIAELLNNIVEGYKSHAESKSIKLSLENNAKNSNKIVDEYSITQIFKNVIDNAVKFTEKGDVSVNIHNNSDNNLEVTICDSGVGIADDYIQKVFSPYDQEEQGYSRTFEGNGLGLALSKKYCDLNNLGITIESKKNKGTTINILFNNHVNGN